MNQKELQAVRNDLLEFVEEFQPYLGRRERRHWCGTYLSGLILDGERKSIEPMAQRLAEHGNVQAMQQFVNQSPWPFEPVQQHLSELLVQNLVQSGPRKRSRLKSSALIFDDTSFPKHGDQSVGVSPQWSGILGKKANCQSLVSWHYADPEVHFPLRAELYLPESWIKYPERLAHAGVPGDRFQLREKWRIGLELLDTVREQVPHQVILCDAGYGQNKEFLSELNKRDEAYIAQIPCSVVFWPYGVKTTHQSQRRQKDRFTGFLLKNRFATVRDPNQRPLSAQAWAELLFREERYWRWINLPNADSTTQKNHKVRVAAIRVRQVNRHNPRAPGEELWLMIEHHIYYPGPHSFGTHAEVKEELKFYTSNLSRDTSTKQLFRLAHLRWKIEQGYQQLKEELGMDHFEGRSWIGFHHHVTLCMMAFGFLLLQKKRNQTGNAHHFHQYAAG
jgi:SRSO17 transposase